MGMNHANTWPDDRLRLWSPPLLESPHGGSCSGELFVLDDRKTHGPICGTLEREEDTWVEKKRVPTRPMAPCLLLCCPRLNRECMFQRLAPC